MSDEYTETAMLTVSARSNEELGRRLAAAYISYQMGITIGYAYKHYTPQDKPVGSFWVNLAEQVTQWLNTHRESPPPLGLVQ